MFKYIDPALKQLRKDAQETEELLISLKFSMSTMDRTQIDPDIYWRNEETVRQLEKQLEHLKSKLESSEWIHSVFD